MRSWEEIGVFPQYGMGLWDGKLEKAIFRK